MSSPADFVVHDDRALPSLTGIRFFAALSVFVSHYTELGLIHTPHRLVQFLDGGRTAVSLFFVLSGFVLAYNYEHLTGLHAARQFWVNRFARLYPGVLIAILIGAAGMVLALRTGAVRLLDWYSLTGIDKPAIVVSLAAQATMTTGWFPFARINQPWNGPAWSVACEVFFYALFPILIAHLRRLTNKPRAILAVLLFAAQGIWIVELRKVLGDRSQFLISQFPITHLFEFVLGVMTALWFIRGGRAWAARRNRRPAILTIAALALAVLSWWQPVNPAYYLMSPLFALAIFGLAAPTRHRQALGWGPLLLLGEASYALYIIHVPIGYLLQAADLPSGYNWLAALAVIGLSVLLFRRVETPARRRIRETLSVAERTTFSTPT